MGPPLVASYSHSTQGPAKFASLEKKSGLTLDMAIRLLKAALPRPILTVEVALAIVEYHVRRNETAKRSHTKTWNERYKGIKPKEPL